jgi:hypothetical protein
MKEALLSNGVRVVSIERLDRLARDLMVQDTAIGDLQRAGQKCDINKAKTGNTIDLASARCLARAMGIKLFELNRAIG